MTIRRAACCCGRLTLTVEGEPLRISICHCLECQRRTGSAFGVQARFRRGAVAVEGQSTPHTRAGDSGNRITFHFCPRCGSTVYYELDHDPDEVGVPVGAFADPEFPPPTLSFYESRRHPWVRMPEDVEHLP